MGRLVDYHTWAQYLDIRFPVLESVEMSEMDRLWQDSSTFNSRVAALPVVCESSTDSRLDREDEYQNLDQAEANET